MMSQSSLISIVIPMYNVEKYIRITLESILKQTYQNFEIILIDDGSADNTSSIVEQIEDSRLFLIKGENHGASYARNLGLSKVKGDYVLFFDADDHMYPDMLETLLNGMISSEADMAIGNNDRIDAVGNIIAQKMEEPELESSSLLYSKRIEDLNCLLGMWPFPDTKLFKTRIIRDNHILFPNAKIGEDLNFYLKYLRCCSSIWKTDRILCSYRILATSMSHKNDSNAMMEITDSFADAEKFYRKQGCSKYYMAALVNQKVLSYIYQANHWIFLFNIKERATLLRFFHGEIRLIEEKDSEYFSEQTRLRIKEFYKTWRRRWFYLSPLHNIYTQFKRKIRGKKDE